MRGPITHHQHLHRGWSVTGDGKELLGTRSFCPFLAVAHPDFFGLHFDGFVDVRRPRRLAFNLESLRCEIVRTAKRDRERTEVPRSTNLKLILVTRD
jgi:hypothetical protein